MILSDLKLTDPRVVVFAVPLAVRREALMCSVPPEEIASLLQRHVPRTVVVPRCRETAELYGAAVESVLYTYRMLGATVLEVDRSSGEIQFRFKVRSGSIEEWRVEVRIFQAEDAGTLQPTVPEETWLMKGGRA